MSTEKTYGNMQNEYKPYKTKAKTKKPKKSKFQSISDVKKHVKEKYGY
jgi:hypothetical protein